MNDATIVANVRRDLREPTPVTVSDTQITAVYTLGIDRLWEALVEVDPRTGRARASISSNSNSFTIPSDVYRIDQVWDMKTNAKSITDATNASPIVVTSASHGFTDADILHVSGIVGNTAGNGTWEMDAVDDNSFKLLGSTGNGAWSSGGKVFAEGSNFSELREIGLEEITGRSKYHYYVRADQIIVDQRDFGNDLILNYVRNPDNGLDDIPAKYHEALVSYAVLKLARPIPANEINAADINGMITFHQNQYNNIMDSIRGMHGKVSGPKYTPDSVMWDTMWD
jgi:hypothetical protein